MKEDRLSIVYDMLNNHEDTKSELVSYNIDPSSKRQCALNVKLSKDSPLLHELESQGFKAIYPAELADEEIARMNEDQRFMYELNSQHALLVDSKEPHLSLNLAGQIASHVYSNSGAGVLDGLNTKDNTLTFFPGCSSRFKEGTHENLQATLTALGYKADLDKDSVTVQSNIPYPSVNKSKFAKIFEMAKDKIHSVAEKLGLHKNKEPKVKQDDDLAI